MARDPVRLALVGAGLFVRDGHLPALKKLGNAFKIVAIFSRTEKTARARAADCPGPVDIYTDLDALLERADIEAVDVALPIQNVPDGVKAALKAGKHVISEKPMAPSVAIGRELLDAYQSYPGQVWMVAENVRYDPGYVKAAEIVRSGELGDPVMAHWAIHADMTSANQYYSTPWRRSGEFQGGYILDGGVHQVAGFRLVVDEISAVSSFVTQVRSDLPPADSMAASFCFDNGALGTFTISYATGNPWNSGLHVLCSKGALRATGRELEVTRGRATESVALPGSNGIQGELAAFAAAIRRGEAQIDTPQQALQDVAVIEAMMRAGQSGRREPVERIV